MFTEHVNSFSTIELIAKMLSNEAVRDDLVWALSRTHVLYLCDSSCWCQVDEEQKLLLPYARRGKPPPIK